MTRLHMLLSAVAMASLALAAALIWLLLADPVQLFTMVAGLTS